MTINISFFEGEPPREVFWRGHPSNDSKVWESVDFRFQDFDGKKASTLARGLTRVIKAITKDPRSFDEHVEEGYGTVETALAFLIAVQAAGRIHGDAKVEVRA